MGIWPTIAKAAQAVIPGNTWTVNPPPHIFIKGVPERYTAAVMEASKHSGIPVDKLAAQFNAENGGNWDPKLRGRADPTDFGMTQLNPVAVKTITGKTPGGVNFFKNNYGHEFASTSPEDQIHASGVYLNYLRQYGLPAAGIKNPTDDDVQTSYNTGAAGYAKAKAGNKQKMQRARTYQDLLDQKIN